MADGLKGYHTSSNGCVGKELACDLCGSCDMYEHDKGADYPHKCRAGGYTAAMSLKDGKIPDGCGEYDKASAGSASKGGGVGSFIGGKIKDAAMKDVKSIGRNLGRMI